MWKQGLLRVSRSIGTVVTLLPSSLHRHHPTSQHPRVGAACFLPPDDDKARQVSVHLDQTKEGKKALCPRKLWAAICLSRQELAIFCLSRASHSLCLSSSIPLPSLRLRHLQPGLLGQNQGFLLIHPPLRDPSLLISMCDSSFLFIFPLSLYSLLLLLLL